MSASYAPFGPTASPDDRLAIFLCHLVALARQAPLEEMFAPTRCERAVALARQLAMYLAHTRLQWPLARVGEAFHRDRTTVGHACRIIEDLRDDPAFDAQVEALELCLDGADPAACA